MSYSNSVSSLTPDEAVVALREQPVPDDQRAARDRAVEIAQSIIQDGALIDQAHTVSISVGGHVRTGPGSALSCCTISVYVTATPPLSYPPAAEESAAEAPETVTEDSRLQSSDQVATGTGQPAEDGPTVQAGG